MENLKVLIEISARHIHVTKSDLAILFGEGHTLTHKKDLSQTGQFACEERVTIKGSKGEFKGVSILGPEREKTQFELSATDARSIGVKAPIRESGDVSGSATVTVVGPAGEIEAVESTIIAKRHVHVTPEDAKTYNLADKEIVMVKLETNGRSLIFDDVVIRVSEKFQTRMHIDVDESNAANVAGELLGEIIKK